MTHDTYCKRVENETILRGFSKSGEIALCCKSQHPFPMNTDFTELSKVKTALDNGEQHRHCRFCWKQEEAGIMSWRQIGNQMTVDSKNVELYLDNTCDQACVYCSPKYSSMWAQEIKHNPEVMPYINDEQWDKQKEQYNHLPKILGYIEELGKVAKDSAPLYINILGGEPLLTSAVKKDVISDIVEAFYKHADDNEHLGITIVTNCNTPDHIIDKTIELLKQNKIRYKNLTLTVNVSVESLGSNAEFVRHGLDWNQFKKNLIKWLSLEFCTVGFSMAVNMITWKTTPDFLKWAFLYAEDYEQRINLNFNTVMFPLHLSIKMLPKDQFYIFDEIIDIVQKNKHLIINEKLYNRLVLQIEQAKDSFGKLSNDLKFKKTALEYFSYIRRRRKQDIRDVNPDLFDYLIKSKKLMEK
jgi:organic radical activating enzyme